MDNKYFSDIYDDFFKVERKEIKVEEKKENDEVNVLEDIDSLYLDNESKNLLKQILEYMDKYSNKENGEIVIQDKSNLVIRVSDGLIYLKKIKKEGKKLMNINDYLNGEKDNLLGLICNKE